LNYSHSPDTDVISGYEAVQSPYTRPFVGLPEEKVSEMVAKTLILHFAEDTEFSTVSVMAAFPDDTTKLTFPSLVISRVGADNWSLSRIGGFYGVISGSETHSIGELKGYCYKATYQLDILTRSIKDQVDWEAKIHRKLRRSSDIHSPRSVGITEIPISDYTNYPEEVVVTDLKIKFRSYKDLESTRVPNPWDQQLHQTAFSLNIWCDVISGQEAPRIQRVAVSGQQI